MMNPHERNLVELIERGQGEDVSLKKPGQELRVDLKEERVTVRLSREEMEAVDRECRVLGVGRSTVIRMLLRQALGLASRHAAASFTR